MNKLNVVIDTNVIVSAFLSSHYEIVMDKSINDAKLITGNIKHFPISPKIITPTEFINLYNK